MLDSIVEDKMGKTFWKEINKGRKKREEIDGSITEGEWSEQFKEELGGSEGR